MHQSSNGISSLKYIITPEGRLINTGTNAAPIWGWEYDLKDHLGNVRVIFKPNADNTGVVRVEYANYFPFGMKMTPSLSQSSTDNKYLYNGKEQQTDFGLNWYDYRARMYDAAIGRWHSVDPHAENYDSWSPYHYAANNPIRYIDPTGMDWIEDKKGNVAWYKDINQDNVPKGYKYIGTEYKGITITSFKPSQSKSGSSYLEITIGYSDSNSKENSYNWVQTVERDGSGQPFVDYDSETKEGQANYPYYQDKYENADAKKDGYDITYFDRPSEKHKNGSFDAELSLIGGSVGAQKGNYVFAPNAGATGKNIYVPKITLNYGFFVKNGKMTVNPIRVVKPSPFHIQTINQIK